MFQMNGIHLRFEGPSARLRIDNPKRRNAMSRAMWRAVPDLVSQALQQAGVRALILEGGPTGVFCAGADISEFESTHADIDESERANREIRGAVDALASCPLPTLALIDGGCIGGGMALALGCDIRLASERASFAITPARLGLSYHPDDIARLVGACGSAAASELLFAGQTWSAQRSLGAGLVNRVVGTDAFDAECARLVDAICANSLDANRALKRGIAAALSNAQEAREQALKDFSALFGGPDFLEGRSAFLQKRAAAFPSHRQSKGSP